jgi:hypothetical protein
MIRSTRYAIRGRPKVCRVERSCVGVLRGSNHGTRLNDSSVLPVYQPADMRFCSFALLVCSAATLQAATPTPAPPAPAKVPGFTYVKNVGNIAEYRLDGNGLQVLLMEEHSSPTLTFMVTYRVGSRNE